MNGNSVVTGEMLVDGRQRDNSFQRKTGYVQQSDIHLPVGLSIMLQPLAY